MTRRNPAQLQFDALTLEGSLLPVEWLAKVAALEAAAQAPADYDIPKGLQLRDELGRFWRIAEALWGEFGAARSGTDPVGAADRFARELLGQVFGFSDLAVAGERTVDGRLFPLALEALGGRVPIVVGPPTEDIEENVPRHGDGTRRRSAWGALQEYLNAADGALWGLATNGLVLRLGRDNASLTRPAWLEADLERIFTEQRFADFSVLWLLIHSSRFGRAGRPPQEARLEEWREIGREEGSRARETLRLGVEEALRALGQGFVAHPANSELRGVLATGALSPAEYFNELLRLVYRMIFLLSVEERGILHPVGTSTTAVMLYADGYGMRRLRERALRHAAHDRHGDLWVSLRPVFAVLGRADGGRSLGLPGLGGLFAKDQCPHLDGAALENRALLTAVFQLAWLREGGALARVNWKDMGVEEFGSVYESLLELVPVVGDGGRRFGFAGEGESAGNARKLTGSYYTPDALVQQLLDTALEPVVAQRLAENPGQAGAEHALLSLTVIDPACGSGHFLLAAARRLAGHLARLRAGGTPGAAEYRHALRDVVTHCIHGVDRNPMALELARMALWLEAYTPDRALGFLDHHLVCGDALLGLLDLSVLKRGIPDEAFKALSGDDKDVVKMLTKLNRAGRKALEERERRGQLGLDLGTRSLAAAFAQLDELADEGIAGVETKRSRYEAVRAEAASSPIALAADLFIGAFLIPKHLAPGERAITEQQAAGSFPTTATLSMALEGTLSGEHPLAAAARRVCTDARVLHWMLAFPQVFGRGGFDLVLGNPPWERLKLQEQEYFSARAPRVAAARNKAERDREIDLLAGAPVGTPERSVYELFIRAKQKAETISLFCRSGARYPLTGTGDVNTYALFAETMVDAVNARGRVGVVLPTGIATDDTTKVFFEHMVSSGRLVRLASFENEEFIFPAVHHSFTFCLFTVAGDRQEEDADLTFFARQPAQAHEVSRRFRLSAADFHLINPNTNTCPVFRSVADAELTKKIHRTVPILVNDAITPAEGNPWGVFYLRLVHYGDHSTELCTEEAARVQGFARDGATWIRGDQRLLPVYESRLIHQFTHRHGTYDTDGEVRPLAIGELRDPRFSVEPRYWVSAAFFESLMEKYTYPFGWFIAYRDVTRAANLRTVLAAVIPRTPAAVTLPVLGASSEAPLFPLLANLNSLVLDYVARQKVGGIHLTFGIVKQLPILSPQAYDSEALTFLRDRVLELTYTAWDLSSWAKDLGYVGEPFSWNPERHAVLRAELDAWFARAYGLTRDDLRYILDPTDVLGPGYPSETFRVLRADEEHEYGEFRTKRLTLEAWDRLFDS